MKVLLSLFIFLISILMLSGCSKSGGGGSSSVQASSNSNSDINTIKAQVSSVSFVNNQLVINGSDLTGLKTVTIKNQNQEAIFNVESATDSQLIANGAKQISLLAGGLFNLILADANGSATFQVTFSVADNSITAAKLNSMSATSGQVLKYNGTSWVPTTLVDAQVYTSTAPLSISVGASPIISISKSTSTADGYLSFLDWNIFNSKEPAISLSTSLKYYRGDKTFVTLNTAAVPESTNLYYTDVRAKAAAILAPISAPTLSNTAIATSDTIQVALGKLQGQASANQTAISTKANILDMTQTITAMRLTGLGVPSSDLDATNKSYVDSTILNSQLWSRGGSGGLYYFGGNVGIGVGEPNAKLQIEGDFNEKVGESVALSFAQELSEMSGLPAYGMGMDANIEIRKKEQKGFLLYRSGIGSTAGYGHKFLVNDVERMRLNGLGFLGLGTNNPTASFSIAPTSMNSEKVIIESAKNGDNIFMTNAPIVLNVGDYIIPNKDPSQARSISGGQTGGIEESRRFEVTPAFTNDTNADFIIYPALVNVDNGKLFVQGSTGNVGVGTTNPNAKLHVETGSNKDPSIGISLNSAISERSGLPAFGFGLAPLDKGGFLTYRAGLKPDSNNGHIFEVNDSEVMRITGDGFVTVTGEIAQSSDRRWKRKITPLVNSIEKLKKITGVSFDWATNDFPDKNFSHKKQIGVIAQDVQAVFPEMVHTDPQGFLSVNYSALAAPLIEAFKLQQNQIESNLVMFKTMQGDLEQIKSMISENKREIAELKAENLKMKNETAELRIAICSMNPKLNLCNLSK